MIGTMDRAMTIRTRPREFTIRSEFVCCIVQSARMSCVEMTILAKPWPILNKKFFVIRTMRRMTIQTIFADRRMLPEERSSFFRMARIALFIYRIRDDQLWSDRAMRVVTIAAGHQTFTDRVMRSALNLRFHFEMASGANFIHVSKSQQRFIRLRCVNGVAANTC